MALRREMTIADSQRQWTSSGTIDGSKIGQPEVLSDRSGKTKASVK
jgi:hypothetical protein